MRKNLFTATWIVLAIIFFMNPSIPDFKNFVASDVKRLPNRAEEATYARVHNYLFFSVYEYAIYSSGNKKLAYRYFGIMKNFWLQEKFTY